MKNQEIVYEALRKICVEQIKKEATNIGVSTEKLSLYINMKRANVSRELNKLVAEGKVKKQKGKPVLYYVELNEKDYICEDKAEAPSIFDTIIGRDASLKNQISLAKAAIVYPPNGLHSLIIGETGVGKSYFAKCMFKYALEIGRIKDKDRFAVFNCADYANNPQLLIGHLFGVKKGTYTGASEDREGIIEKGRDGILFLDEVHRLPPEGQEILFTLIDEGKYIPLGGTEGIPINVMIISATTENIGSTLLKTFTRRIPVTIALPALRDRKAAERLELIQRFFADESKRISKKINIDEEVITALLNYDCLNNIGQLKSDIQIASAKAFLRNIFNEEDIHIKVEDFSYEVKGGLLASKKINPRGLKVSFSDEIRKDINYDIEDEYSVSRDIYEFIEERTKILTAKGLDQEEIKSKLTSDVEDFINTYILSIREENDKDDIKRIVNNELYEFLKSFMHLAEYKLKRKIPQNIFLGLLLHIDTFLARIKENRGIENTKIDEIRKKYPEEFKLALSLAYKLEEKYEITIPIGEIGFITMFFAAENKKVRSKVAVIVAMHGNTTATSIAEVANQLLNTNHVAGFDMPLSMKPEEALIKIQELIKEKDQGRGAVLLVDMGSLKFFGKIIKENTGIYVETIDMITTATVIEAARKAMLYENIDEIVKCAERESRYIGDFIEENLKADKKVIVTACSTGEGTAIKLKELVSINFESDKYEIINLSIKDREEFYNAIDNIRKKYTITYVISAFDPQLEGVEYIPIDRFFKEFVGEDFEEKVNDEDMISIINKVYKDHLNINNCDFIIRKFIKTVSNMKYSHGIYVDEDKLMGLLMHFGCVLEKLINKEETRDCKNLSLIKARYGDLFKDLKTSIKDIEENLNIEIPEDELANITEILVNI